jgi:hypothetical protein
MAAQSLVAQQFEDPFTDPTSFGNIALERGYITREDLVAAVDQQSRRAPLGEILLDMGKLTALQIEDVLMEQARRRCPDADCRAEVELQYQRRILGHAGRAIMGAAVAAQSFVVAVGELGEAIKNIKG